MASAIVSIEVTIGPRLARLVHLQALLAQLVEEQPWNQDAQEALVIAQDLVMTANKP